MSLERISTGKRGEGLALSYLRRHGYKILTKNYKTRMGEIDIIGNDNGCIVFIEVRSINSERFGLPEYTINRKKQHRIAKAALSYIKRFGLEDKDCRFDTVCVKEVDSANPDIDLIKDAFDLNSRYRY